MSTVAPAGRSLRSVLLLTLVLALTLPIVALVTPARPAAAAEATTTSSLNLRNGPGTNYDVILVMPAGATVTLVGGSGNGFLEVTYNGTTGWASATYLDTGGGSGSGTAVVTSSLNLRAGPSTGDAVLAVMPAGASITLTGDSANGFLSVSYNGREGWAFAAYLDTGGGTPPPDPDPDPGPGTGGSATVTSNLNLRAGPSTGDRVLMVMPAGASVTLTGQSSNGFLSVSYNGTSGWAHSDYLDTDGGTPPPDPDPDPGTGETATVTSNLNLRGGPGTSFNVITVMPAGATVELAGGSSNGFLEVIYNGTSGWASASYLDTGGGTPPPDPDPTGSAVVISGLNLRAGPSLGDAVILVMPAGASVTITGSPQNGFYPVSYGGSSGWAHGDYLDFDGGSNPPPTGGSGIVWPFESGTSWRFIQGHNGGTHQGEDYYAFDLARTSGSTAGQAIYAPVSGTVVWNDPNSGGLLINMGNGYGVAMYHVTFLSSLSRGDLVTQGDYLGTISAPGGPGYAVTPHLHLALYNISGGGRSAAPFSGGNAISGQSFPDIGGSNQYGGTVITV